MLVEKTLNTAMLEADSSFVRPEPCDLRQLIGQVIQSFQPRLREQNASISFEEDGQDFMASVDKLHTQGVIINLIDNSLKYGRAPVRIGLKLKEHASSIQLCVTDNGPGIPEEYQDKVFDKFFRVPAGNLHNIKGFGLGLSYAAQVMKQHHGSIRLSKAPSGGCLFTLTF
jgi:signal transduction histidine kinase